MSTSNNSELTTN